MKELSESVHRDVNTLVLKLKKRIEELETLVDQLESSLESKNKTIEDIMAITYKY